ncbi:MAG: hypothetical protein AAGA75_19730 [Cyanobacteria bacterium P01_E01_bin.6]
MTTRTQLIQSHLSILPAPKAENSEICDQITELLLQLRDSGDQIALLQVVTAAAAYAQQIASR